MFKKREMLIFGLFGLLFLLLFIKKEGAEQYTGLIPGSGGQPPPLEVPPWVQTIDDFIKWIKETEEFNAIPASGFRGDIGRMLNGLRDCSPGVFEQNYARIHGYYGGALRVHQKVVGNRKGGPVYTNALRILKTIIDNALRLKNPCKPPPPVIKNKNIINPYPPGTPGGWWYKAGKFIFYPYLKKVSPGPTTESGAKPLPPIQDIFPKTKPPWTGSNTGGGIPGAGTAFQIFLFYCDTPGGQQMLEDFRLQLQEDPSSLLPWNAVMRALADSGKDLRRVWLWLKSLGRPINSNDFNNIPPNINSMYTQFIQQLCPQDVNTFPSFNGRIPYGSSPGRISLEVPVPPPPTTSPPGDLCQEFKNKANFILIPPSSPQSGYKVKVGLMPYSNAQVPISVTVYQGGSAILGPFQFATNDGDVELNLGSNCGTFTLDAGLSGSTYANCDHAIGSFTKDCQTGAITPTTGNVYTPTQFPGTGGPPGSECSTANNPACNAITCITSQGQQGTCQLSAGTCTCTPIQPPPNPCGNYPNCNNNACDAGTGPNSGRCEAQGNTCTCIKRIVTPEPPGGGQNILYGGPSSYRIRTVTGRGISDITGMASAFLPDDIVEITSDPQYIYITEHNNFDPVEGLSVVMHVFDRSGRFLKLFDENNQLIEERTYLGNSNLVKEIIFPIDKLKYVYQYDNSGNIKKEELVDLSNNEILEEIWFNIKDHPSMQEYSIVDFYTEDLISNIRPFMFMYERKSDGIRGYYQGTDTIKIVKSYANSPNGAYVSSQKVYKNNNFEGEVRVILDSTGLLDVILVIDRTGSVVQYIDFRYKYYNCLNGQQVYIDNLYLPLIQQRLTYRYNTNNYCDVIPNMLIDILYDNGQSALQYDPSLVPIIADAVGLSELFYGFVSEDVARFIIEY